LVFFFLFSLALVLLILFGEASGLALHLSGFWPLLLILFAFLALGIAGRSSRRRADRSAVIAFERSRR
jgi:hypothetical protein